ncbi:carbonate dehydratase [Mollisia scopiformis]|uniref:Carbonic anhydrase n=1 Tax=Mollisia scopiformis TaxID=149040 RepID=A0A194XNM9_MOLSC|nr:carbonate dehydratase [Mollisia scopiformis]KUJ21761.1 carbonate dehydratase [Mollisia scopiformis]
MASQRGDAFDYALKSNEAWANYKGHQNPAFFEKLATGQSPSILWLGCSDSRVPETTLLGLQPGDVFVHRNIANIISPTDINSNAVIEYAVVHLKVSHIVLCGHTFCGGAGAALGDSRVGGVIDAWITPLRAIRKAHDEELNAIKDSAKRAVRLAELNVEAGVQVLLSNFVVEEAVKDRGLKVHGAVYDIACGKVRDLKCGNSGSLPGSATEEELEIIKGNHGMLVFGGDGAKMAIR